VPGPDGLAVHYVKLEQPASDIFNPRLLWVFAVAFPAAFNDLRPTMSGRRISAVADARFTACPQCDVPPMLPRSASAHIDECGFESYTFACPHCGTPLAGIVDPADDALLLSKIAA
jgi:hypothetical protein